MFTGIIECMGAVVEITRDRKNVDFVLESAISDALKIDQSLAHNGVCLTVVEVGSGFHRVTAIDETLQRSNLGDWKLGTRVNLERCMAMNGRLDGHIVQGHVDARGTCIAVEDFGGSWKYRFEYPREYAALLVDKGSICVNGTSLTVVSPSDHAFSVAIIPYTYENTNFHALSVGDSVNLEFDLIGKYLARHIEVHGRGTEFRG